MSLFQSLLEALNHSQNILVKRMAKSADYNPDTVHDELFDKYRNNTVNGNIVLPIGSDHLEAPIDIRSHLAKHGWFVHNYKAGLAGRYVDENGEKKLRVKKIGGVLQDTGADKVDSSVLRDVVKKDENGKPILDSNNRNIFIKGKQSILHQFNNDTSRNSVNSDHQMVISKAIPDIGGITSGRSWEAASCMRLPNSSSDDPKCREAGVHHDSIQSLFKNHSLAVYATKIGDDSIERPTGRVLLNKYVSSSGHEIYRIGSTEFGNPPKNFKKNVEKFAEQNWPAKDEEYRSAVSYQDVKEKLTGAAKKVGYHKTSDGYEHYNENGELHDFVDSKGKTQPAKESMDNNFHTVKEHYKNGKLHNENGAAKIVSDLHGSTVSSHYIDGKLHNLNGAAIKLKLAKGRGFMRHGIDTELTHHESYYVDNQLHREGDKPAYDEGHLGGYRNRKYSVYGLDHRNGDKPSNITEYSQGSSDLKYNHYGTPRKGNKPFRVTNFSGRVSKYHETPNGDIHKIAIENGEKEHYFTGSHEARIKGNTIDITHQESRTMKHKYKFEKDDAGNIHVTSDQMKYKYPIILKNGKITMSKGSSTLNGNPIDVNDRPIMSAEDYHNEDSYNKNEAHKTLKWGIQRGIENPHVSDYFKKLHNRVKNELENPH